MPQQVLIDCVDVLADAPVAICGCFLREQVVACDVVDVAEGCRFHELKCWVVEARQKLSGRHGFLVDNGGWLSCNGASQTAQDHDRDDQRPYWEGSRWNES